MTTPTFNKVHKHATMVIVGGIIYLVFEVFARAAAGATIGYKVGDMTISMASLVGWTSLWMILIGGICCYLLGWLNEWKWSKRLPLIIQALLGVLIFVWPIELCTGLLLNKVFGLGIWDYSHVPLNLFGQITLRSLPGFLLVGVFALWLDDFLRHWHLGAPRPGTMLSYYGRAITFKR